MQQLDQVIMAEKAAKRFDFSTLLCSLTPLLRKKKKSARSHDPSPTPSNPPTPAPTLPLSPTVAPPCAFQDASSSSAVFWKIDRNPG